MARTILHIWGGGDWSVGIGSTDATITIEDNFLKHDKGQVEDLKKFFNEYYDNGRLNIMTDEEYEEHLAMEAEAYGCEYAKGV